MIWVDLIYNLALLVALSVISGFVEARWRRDTRLGMLLQGVVFGGAAAIGMFRPFVFSPGLIFDGRSVMISLGALFFGPWAAAVAGLMTIPLRLAQGGPGAVMGVLVILTSATIGVSFHPRRQERAEGISAPTLFFFGLLVHLAMLAMTVALPPDLILPVLKRIAGPVMLIYPLATVLVGKILSDQSARRRSLAVLQESEQRFRAIFNSTYQFTGLLTPDGLLTEANQTALDYAGCRLKDVMDRPFWETPWWRGNDARVQRLRAAIARAAGGAFVRYEEDLQGKGGKVGVFEFSLSPVLDPAGRVRLLVPEAHDITERTRAANLLRQAPPPPRQPLNSGARSCTRRTGPTPRTVFKQPFASTNGWRTSTGWSCPPARFAGSAPWATRPTMPTAPPCAWRASASTSPDAKAPRRSGIRCGCS